MERQRSYRGLRFYREKIMIITSDQKIAGVPAVKLRNFFRRYRELEIHAETVIDYFHFSALAAQSLIDALIQHGFLEIEVNKTFPHLGSYYGVTRKGSSLANASAAKPLLRSTAERLLTEILDRIQVVNVRSEFVFRVRYVLLFGSMLTNAPRVGDIDLVMELERKEQAAISPFERPHRARLKGALKCQFPLFQFEPPWGRPEISLYLHNRSRAYSIHEYIGIRSIKGLQYQLLFGDIPDPSFRLPNAIQVFRAIGPLMRSD